MIYIYAQREACQDRLVATLDELDQVVPFLNLVDQYGYWPEGYEVVVFSKSTGLVYHYTDKLENIGRFDTRASFLVDKMPEVFDTPTPSYGPASDAQEWWG
jgi:hypothetical protein